MNKYYPILVSKAGELRALSQLDQNEKTKVSPLIQMISDSKERVMNFASDHWSFEGNQLLIDFSLYPNEGELYEILTELSDKRVNVIPTVVPTSGDLIFSELKDLKDTGVISELCIRIPSVDHDLLDLENTFKEIFDKTGFTDNEAVLLLDFGFISDKLINQYVAKAFESLDMLSIIYDFQNYIIASGSFPENLSDFDASDTPYYISRPEWSFWLSLKSSFVQDIQLSYADYGTKNPTFSDARFAGTCSIKYTIEGNYIIYRGVRSDRHKLGNGQFSKFASFLCQLRDYSGEEFSHGDSKIMRIGSEYPDSIKNPGNSQTWVEISQNHHISLVSRLLN